MLNTLLLLSENNIKKVLKKRIIGLKNQHESAQNSISQWDKHTNAAAKLPMQ